MSELTRRFSKVGARLRGRYHRHAARNECEEALRFDAIRDQLGGKWAKCEDSVCALITKIIERHKLAPVSLRHDREIFYLTYRGLSRNEASERTAKIASDITVALTGALNLSHFGSHARAPLPRSGRRGRRDMWGLTSFAKRIINWFGKRKIAPPEPSGRECSLGSSGGVRQPSPATAAQWVGAGHVLASNHPGSDSTPEMPWPRRSAGVNAVDAAYIGVPMSQTHDTRHPAGHGAPHEFPAREPALKPSFDEVAGIEALLSLEGDRLAAAQRQIAEARQFPPSNLQFIFRPLWSVKASVLGFSTVLPAHIRNGTELRVGYDMLPAKFTNEQLSFLDELVLKNAVKICLEEEAGKRPVLLVIPVHYDGLSQPGRLERYAKICTHIPASARKFLSFEIWGLSGAYGHQHILKILSVLRRYSGLQLGMLSQAPNDLSFWNTVGLHGLGIDVGEWSRRHENEKALIEALERFRLCTYRSGLRSYARGVSTRSIALACVAAGFDFLDGNVIQQTLEPSTIRRFVLQDLYRQITP